MLIQFGLFAQTSCPNSVINGDFEAGNTGFTSGLAYNCDCADATVCVNANFGQKCRGWSTLGNHTSGGTKYLIVDGSSTGPVNVWATNVPVSPGDTYIFSFWVATAYVSRDLIFDLGMIVNGQTVRQFTVSQATPTWTQYSVTGICPVGLRSMPIAIRQMSAGSFRDFGIDDIYFACCDCKADYTTTYLDGCGKIQFNNTSVVPGGISYSWDFGDPASGMSNTSTEPNPIHQFSKCGTYNVCLTLKGEGCSSKICYTVDASDNTLPIIICPRNQTVNTNPGQCYYTGTLPQPSVSDNCDPSPEIICSLVTPNGSVLITPQTQFPKGENSIVCFARDKCGNLSRSCAYILTVRDNQAPKITCPISTSVTGTINAQGRCQAVVRNLSPTVTDNCSMLTITYAVGGATTATGSNDASGITFLEGVSTVTYTVVDMDGNKATCSFTVTVNPCCNPCENRDVVVRSPKGDSCCRVLDIRNDCKQNYFTKLELKLLTPGVIFGSHFTGGPSPSDWSNPVSTNTEIEWTHVSGYIPNGSIPGLINFCLDGIDQTSEIPQKVVLNWITPGTDVRDKVACSDTLIFECKQTNFPCIKVLEDRIVCKKDPQGNTYYQYTLTFKNSASPPHVATELVFSQIGSPPVTVLPNPVTFPPLLPNGTSTITTNIYGSGLNPGDKLCFEVRLHDALNPGNWYCFEADTVCIFIPECDSCKCGTFSDMSFRPAKGVMNIPVKCGDQLKFDCSSQFDLIISGSFMCRGANCNPPQPIVHWQLRQLPSGAVIDSGHINATPAFSLSLLNAYFVTSGSYELTFSANCNGKPCPPCKFIIVVTGCPCCRNLEVLTHNILKAVSITVDNSSCKATLKIGKLPECERIHLIDWGQGPPQYGPFVAGDKPMFTYSGSGTYIITYLAFEVNPVTGTLCNEKLFRDTIRLDCGRGYCLNNLVPNPSFEQYTVCPPGISPPFTASSWSLPTGGSSDYYNSCAPVASNVSTPINSFGNQTPRSGSGYAGFILRPTNLYREYLEVPLTTPLVAGNTYQVSFYVSLADQASWAIDKFGAYLSVGSVGPIVTAPVLPFVPQIMHPTGTFITDKTNWTQISGTYLATGGEDHLVIGNFYDNVATVPQTGQGGFYPGSYYYIDDVSVCASCVTPPCDSCCTDSLTFAALVNQGFTIDNIGCSVTVTAPQFDSCYSFSTPPILDGGFGLQVITDPSGSWTFNFTQSGVHQICVTVFDGCQSKKMCTTVRVNCDSCECGALDWATFLQINGGFSKPIRCGGNNIPALPVPCPKPGLDYLLHGNYRCIPDACGNDTVRWILDRPGALSDVPGVSTATYPHFDVIIPWSLCTIPGTYVLHISRKCGGKDCPCSFKFEIPPCPCPCDQLKGDLAAGFQTVGIQPLNSCKRNFRPFALCPRDIVTWTVNGVVVPGTTTGNSVKMITFNGPGTYLVCMTVLRTDANGQKCEGRFCQKVKVKCKPGGVNPNLTFCANDVIQNGDFTEGVETGHLDRGPRKPWTANVPINGQSFVFEVDSSGSGDAGHLILNGGRGSFASVWQQVNLVPNVFTTIEFDYKNYLGKSSPVGTFIEFRLEPDSISGGPSQVLYQHMISDTSAAWTNVLVSVKTSPNPDFKYLFICVQNDDDALQSLVGIDNLSMCSSSVSDAKHLSALKPIRIFPNPNPGSFNVELPQAATAGTTLRVTDLAGRLVLEKPTQTGNVLQTVEAENLAGGMYLLQVIEKGRIVGVEKFVKQ